MKCVFRRYHAVAATVALIIVTVGAACGGSADHHAEQTDGPNPTEPTTAARHTEPPSVERATTTTPPTGEVSLVFGGDMHFEGALRGALSESPAASLAGVASVLDRADLSVVNLETAVATGGTAAAKQFTFRAPPAALDVLLDQGIDVIGMANNHALDFGQAGLAETLTAVAERDAPVIGIGANADQAFAPFTTTVQGVRVAIIAATQVLDGSLATAWTATATQGGVASAKDRARLSAAVRSAATTTDLVVVFLHWGTETQQCPNADQQSLAAQLVDAGADVIVGGHAHRIQGGGYLGNSYVEYGLGNFQFLGGSDASRSGGLLEVVANAGGGISAQWHPYRIDARGRPQLLTGAAADQQRASWDALRTCAKLSPTAHSGQ